MLIGDHLTLAETYDATSDTPGPISSSAHCVSITYGTLAPTSGDRRLHV